MGRPGVLMVSGAYFPEISGGGLQCRELVRALGDRARCTVLTTSTDRSLPAVGSVDGVPVHRVFVDLARRTSVVAAAVRLLARFVALRAGFEIVHVHGFSRKSMLLIPLARLLGKRVVLKLGSAGWDDPQAVRARGRAGFACYARADLFVGVSPRLRDLYGASHLPRGAFRLVPNGVDLARFRPAEPGERAALRRELELPDDLPLVLFVGFFSREKGPDLLFDAWAGLRGNGLPDSGLVFVGATRSRYYEIDRDLAGRIRAEAQRLDLEKRVLFVEQTHAVERYYRAADVFVLPSSREGLPNALLEAMATALPCVATRLPGVTDAVIEDAANGLLVPPGSATALRDALRRVLEDPARAIELGRRARLTVERGYAIEETARRCLDAYRDLTGAPRPAG